MALSFVKAVSRYFGKKDGQTLAQFAEEVQYLTPEDRAELAPLLSAELGEEVTPEKGS